MKAKRRKLVPVQGSADSSFKTRCDFLISVFSDPVAAEDTINHLQEAYERDLKRFGVAKARTLYCKNAFISLWPLIKWVFRRSIIIGIAKHYLPLIDTMKHLFR